MAGGGQGLSTALKELPVEQQKALSSIYLFLVQVSRCTTGVPSTLLFARSNVHYLRFTL